jgi:hypothetical protein
MIMTFGLPWLGHLPIASSAPQVDDELTVERDGERGSLVQAAVEVVPERVLEPSESVVAEPLYL